MLLSYWKGSSGPSSLSLSQRRVSGPVAGLKRTPSAMPTSRSDTLRPTWDSPPRGLAARQPKLLDRLAKLLLQVLVARDLDRHPGRAAVSEQLVVDLAGRLVGLLDVVVQVFVVREPLNVGPRRLDRSSHPCPSFASSFPWLSTWSLPARNRRKRAYVRLRQGCLDHLVDRVDRDEGQALRTSFGRSSRSPRSPAAG